MVKSHTLAALFLLPLRVLSSQAPDKDVFTDDNINLLQLRASPKAISNSSKVAVRRSRADPGDLERAQCPHEIEAELAAQGDKRFGCEGTMRAQETVECAMWGEPHVTSLFEGFPWTEFDVWYRPGLYRLAAAKDGSWEVQMFSCGIFMTSVAVRYGKTIVNVYVDEDGVMRTVLNGEDVELPAEGRHGVKLTEGHRTIKIDNNGRGTMAEGNSGRGWTKEDRRTRASASMPGTCIDNPAGQVSVEIAQDNSEDRWNQWKEFNKAWGNFAKNLNIKIEAAKDSVTGVGSLADDPLSVCNTPLLKGTNPWDNKNHFSLHRVMNWPQEEVAPENSLFVIGDKVCTGCINVMGWENGRGQKDANGRGIRELGETSCAAQVQEHRNAERVTLESACRDAGMAIATAAEACSALQENPEFFTDCQIDYCASGGRMEVVAEAIEEEQIENPQPVCVKAGEDCDPASKCCNALRDQATLTLDNVVRNDACSGGEVRYGNALTQNGQVMDLVVKPVGDLQCGGKLVDAKFGSRNAQIGSLGVRAGTAQDFEFKFVQTGTDTPASPQNLMMTFLDLDQGKKNKQRESVKVCGSGNAVTSDDTELDIQTNGDCIEVTSTTAGTGKDNPDSVEGMSQLQRARTVAFDVAGPTFTATLAVSKKGRNPRRFNFAGHPSVACVLK